MRALSLSACNLIVLLIHKLFLGFSEGAHLESHHPQMAVQVVGLVVQVAGLVLRTVDSEGLEVLQLQQ